MKRTLCLTSALGIFCAVGVARADDPFAGGADALAVAESDGSGSLRAKLKLKKMTADMIMLMVTGVDDSKFPSCVLSGKVLKAAKKKDKHFKLLGRGKVYRFTPFLKPLKKRGAGIDLTHKMTQNNLGACYYPPKTKLVLKIKGVDMKSKTFIASEIYLK